MESAPETLFNLVKIYSPSGSERAAVDYLVARMKELNFTRAFADEAGNAVGVMGEGPRQIVLLGHIDTVPGEIPVQLSPLPKSGEGPGVRALYGRGSVDAKGPLAAFVDAVAAVGPLEGWQIVVIGAVEEERDSDGARHVVSRYHPEFTVIGEPNRWDRVALGYKGSAWAKVTVQREQAHTAVEQENACEAAVNAWRTVKAWEAEFNAGRGRHFDRLMLTLRDLSSGSDHYVEWAHFDLGARLPLDLPPEKWYAELNNILSAEKTPGLSIQPAGFPIPAYLGEKNTRLVRAFLAGIRSVGGQPGFVLKTGTADLNIVAPAWGCPAVAYGPGDSSLDHTPNEHLSLEEYRRAVDVLKTTIKRAGKIENDL